MRSLTKREKIILMLCCGVTFAYLSWNGVWKPLQKQEMFLEREIPKSEKLLQKNLAIIRKGRQAKQAYEQHMSSLIQKRSDEEEMSAILSQVEFLANEIGMRIAEIKPKRVRTVDFYNRFSVSLAVEGKLEDIVHFLYILQNAPYYFNVDEIKFETESSSPIFLNCAFSLNRILIPEK